MSKSVCTAAYVGGGGLPFSDTFDVCRYANDKMINAVLVFNNNGQPRLTKFYTQLVGLLCIRLIIELDG